MHVHPSHASGYRSLNSFTSLGSSSARWLPLCPFWPPRFRFDLGFFSQRHLNVARRSAMVPFGGLRFCFQPIQLSENEVFGRDNLPHRDAPDGREREVALVADRREPLPPSACSRSSGGSESSKVQQSQAVSTQVRDFPLEVRPGSFRSVPPRSGSSEG